MSQRNKIKMSNTKVKALLFAVGFSLALSACDSAESDAKKAVRAQLKDPESAKFGEFILVNDNRACLEVNARNAFGGYTGIQMAALAKGTKYNEGWIAFAILEMSRDVCIKAVKEFNFNQ